MYGMGSLFGGVFGLLILLFLLVLAILWFILPFAIFGIKPKLDGIFQELNETNRLLSTLISISKPPASSPAMNAGKKTDPSGK